MPSSRDNLRTFFALCPRAEAAQALAALAAELGAACDGRALASASLHLTLAFIGPTPPARLEALRVAGAQAARGSRPVRLILSEVGGPHGGDLAWIAGEAPPDDPIRELHAKLTDGLVKAGFPTERRSFRPHVTLVRKCRRRVGARAVAPIALESRELVLMASELGREGARYTPLAAWPLAESAGDR